MEKKTKLENVQHCHDLWSVHSKTFHQVYMYSSFEICKNSYFYEIEMVNGGSIEIGWATRLAVLDRKNGFADNGQSVVLKSNFSTPGDTIGSFVNVEKKLIIFYYNGKVADVPIDNDFFEFVPIFATASLPPNKQIIVNFGHKPFKYPPSSKHIYRTFHFETLANHQYFQLKQFSNLIKWHCVNKKFHLFKYSQDTIFEPIFFNDLKQNEFDKMALKIQSMILEKKNITVILNYFNSMFDKSETKIKYCRFIQSTIEIIGNNIENFNNEFACCLSTIYCKFINKIAFHNFHAIILFYIENLQLDSNNDITKIRNLVIILAHYRFFHVLGLCCSYIIEKSAEFLINVINRNTDLWTKLFSLIALIKIHYLKSKTKKYEIRHLKHLECASDITNTLNNFILHWKNKFDVNNELKNIQNVSDLSIQLQIYLCANTYHKLTTINDQSLVSQNDAISNFNESLIEMNPLDKSNFLQVSPSNLMIRNDEIGFKKIRSKFYINFGTFYFEVIILTAGSMRIGLAAKQISIQDCYIGDDKLSIGIDGYSQFVKMNKKEYTFKDSSLPRWKVGDVIGIYIDFYKQNVLFGINNQIIELNGNPFEEEFIFSSLPCHVAANLGTFQQCYFNFSVKSVPPVYLSNSSQLGEVVNISNSMFLYHSTNRMQDFSGSEHTLD